MTKTAFLLKKEETKKHTILTVELTNPTVGEVEEAVAFIKANPLFDNKNKFIVEFSKPVDVQHSRGKEVTKQKITVRFFKSTIGRLCYTFHRRSGYPVSMLPCRDIVKVSYPISKDREAEHKETVEKILNRRYDSITWSHLKADDLKYVETTIVNITQKFPNFVINELKKAFKDKTDYRYRLPGEKRDLSVSTKMCDDGVFRAWFSSEYAGCGNGQYYLLLNPTTASFCEND